MNNPISKTREYNIWAMMRQRCANPRAKNYANYGAKGVTVCERWQKFSAFLGDMGVAPSGEHTLDRIDNSLGYTPGNCRWADVETQQNNRTNGVHITAFGETLSLAQWARKTGLSVDQVTHRIKVMGMPPEKAFTTPRMSWNQQEVIQMTLDGAEVARFPSNAAARKAFGAGVWNVLSGRANSAYGFKWRYVPLA